MKTEVVSALFIFLLLKLCPSPSSARIYGTAWQSSTFNNLTAGLAVDDDPRTCSQTGFGYGQWWTMDMGKPTDITGMKLKGSINVAFNVRIGDDKKDVGDRDGSNLNPRCTTSYYELVDGQTMSLICDRQLTGRYVSFQVADYNVIMRMSLCDIALF